MAGTQATQSAGAVVLVSLVLLSTQVAVSRGFQPFQNPPWSPSNYNMSLSSISMFCNSSGWLSPLRSPAAFGIASTDWSNDKKDWALARPMDCEERLVTQATMIKQANPAAWPFAYRNLVKALPWFSTVREKLEDPQYSGWFLHFSGKGNYHVPDCDANYDPPLCSTLYHDQEQSPAVPTPSNPNPDGRCSVTCDCGGVPCGEYLFDWRNDTLLPWVLENVLGGPNGLGNDNIKGFFIDDFWCANLINGTGACNDPVQGPTEIDRNSQADMGLSDRDIADITNAWLAAMTVAQQYILDHGGYTWSLIPGQDNANASPLVVNKGNCVSHLTEACSAANRWQSAPLMHGINMGTGNGTLPSLDADIAAFLLMRGPWAFTGAGYWGMSWPVGQTWNSTNVPVPRPIQMDADYGKPLDARCEQVSSGVFSRRYSNTVVTLDCKTYQAKFVPPVF